MIECRQSATKLCQLSLYAGYVLVSARFSLCINAIVDDYVELFHLLLSYEWHFCASHICLSNLVSRSAETLLDVDSELPTTRVQSAKLCFRTSSEDKDK